MFILYSLVLIIYVKRERERSFTSYIFSIGVHKFIRIFELMITFIILVEMILFDDSESTMKEPRSRLDSAAIAVRSDRDHGVLLRLVLTVR